MAITICMVALDAGAKIAGGGIPKAWSARWPGSPALSGAGKKDNTLSYSAGECSIIFGVMPAPIPWSDLERPCECSVLWDEATAVMKRHKRHVIVTAMGECSPIELMKVLTQATVAFLDACEGAVGVFWCTSELVLSPDLFREIACESLPNEYPLAIWVNCLIGAREGAETAGFTRGMASLGLMDLECTSSPEPPEELLGRLFGLAEYILRQGAVIKDGDTIGQDANEKIKIIYQPSTFGLEGLVMRLDYGGGKSATGGMTTYGRLHALGTLLCTIGFGYFLYTAVPLLRGSFLRHVVFIPAILVFGFVLLIASDNLLRKLFGWQAFADPPN